MTREEAIELLGCIYMEVSTDEDKEAVDMAIETLKEQRPHGEWVPCSERLPDVGQEIYLVTIDYGDGLSCVAPRFFFNEEIGWNEAEEYITAWMPSPKPYRKEGGEAE